MRNRGRLGLRLLSGAAGLAALLSLAPPAAACGGFFCRSARPVNQAAERIVFAADDDGTVTAVIQILYDGPSESFSWLLPLPSVPDEIGVASDMAFQRLQLATNPVYNLITRIEGSCQQSVAAPSGGGGDPTFTVGSAGKAAGGVKVEGSGVIGSFEWTVISVDDTASDPADVAVEWLTDSGYDVPDQAPGLLRPYLEDGLYLLGLRLVKGADTGSIRPIRVTYQADLPMIPIQLTAVAANDDMGVLAWVLSRARAVPYNYLSLELNQARINWLDPASNYGDLVAQAADEAGGQGFVTELADDTTRLADQIWSSSEQAAWAAINAGSYTSLRQIFEITYSRYQSYSGFWDVVRATITLPEGVNADDLRLCPSCYEDYLAFSPSGYLAALEAQVIEPIRSVQELIDDHEYVTRLYTALSAAEMTVDPVFSFNPDLDPVDNVHTAERVIECASGLRQSEAPWHIDLPQGGQVHGSGMGQDWPEALSEQPANQRIVQVGESGDGRVVEDNSDEILESLDEYNDSLDFPEPGSGGTTGTGATTSTGGVLIIGPTGGLTSGGASTGGAATEDPEATPTEATPSGGCALGRRGSAEAGALWLLLALFAARARRRRSARAPG